MWFDGERKPDTIYVANVSRGKDSTAMLRAIRLMGWPLDAVVAVDIWATQDIPAELPPMVEFKEEWDKKCLENFEIPVTRLCATKRERERDSQREDGECHSQRETYEDYFYRKRGEGQFIGANVGFPMQRNGWCKKLKTEQVDVRGHLLSKGLPAERERENGGADGIQAQIYRHSDFRCNGVHGATPTSKDQQLRLPDYDQKRGKLVYRPQEGCDQIKGFPWRKGPWCQDRLKSKKLDNPFLLSAGARRRK